MSFYKKIFNEKFGVYYPSAVTVGQPVPVKKVAKRLSQMCTVTYADVMAVLGDFDFQKQVEAIRVQFVPAREGAQTKGSVSTRGLVPTGIEWLPYDPAMEKADGGTTTEPDGEEGGGGGTEPGSGDEDSFG